MQLKDNTSVTQLKRLGVRQLGEIETSTLLELLRHRILRSALEMEEDIMSEKTHIDDVQELESLSEGAIETVISIQAAIDTADANGVW